MECLYFSLLLHWYSTSALSPNRNINCIRLFFFVCFFFWYEISSLKRKLEWVTKVTRRLLSKLMSDQIYLFSGECRDNTRKWEYMLGGKVLSSALCWMSVELHVVLPSSQKLKYRSIYRGLSVMVHATPRKIETIWNPSGLIWGHL